MRFSWKKPWYLSLCCCWFCDVATHCPANVIPCASVVRGRVWSQSEFVTNWLTAKPVSYACCQPRWSAKMRSSDTGLVLFLFQDEWLNNNEWIKQTNKKNFFHPPLECRICNVNFYLEIMWMNWASLAAIRVSLEPKTPTSAHAHKRRQSGSRTGQTAGVKMVGDQNKHKPRHRLRCHRCRHRL